MSANIADIYNYYKSLKVISPQSSIKLNKLQILTEVNGDNFDIAAPDLGAKFYDFEISNIVSPRSKEAESAQDGKNNKGANANQQPQQSQQSQSSDTAPATVLQPVDINN